MDISTTNKSILVTYKYLKIDISYLWHVCMLLLKLILYDIIEKGPMP